MGVKKLTHSASEEVIEKAKRIASRNKTSVSAMFSRFVHGISEEESSLAPITSRAAGMIKLPADRTDQEHLVYCPLNIFTN